MGWRECSPFGSAGNIHHCRDWLIGRVCMVSYLINRNTSSASWEGGRPREIMHQPLRRIIPAGVIPPCMRGAVTACTKTVSGPALSD